MGNKQSLTAEISPTYPYYQNNIPRTFQHIQSTRIYQMLQLLQTNLSTTTLTSTPKRKKTRDRPEDTVISSKETYLKSPKKKKNHKGEGRALNMKSNQNMKAGLLECSDAKTVKKKTYGNNELAQSCIACKKKKKKGVEWAAMYYYC